MGAHLTAWIGAFSYPAVFLLLIGGGVGLPISEDLVVITGGALAAQGKALFPLMILASYLGMVTGDFLIFRVGKRVGPAIFSSAKFRKLLTPARVAWLEDHFRKRGALTLILVRFMPGFRVPAYLMAGATRFRSRKFLLVDGMAAAVSAPTWSYIGYRFGRAAFEKAHAASLWVVLGLVVAIATFFTVRFILRRRAAAISRRAPRALESEDPSRLEARVASEP